MRTLEEVFWSYIGHGNKDIDCRSFITLCRNSGLKDASFQDDQAEHIFMKSMPLARHRLDFARLGCALRLVAKAKGVEENALHQLIIDAHASKPRQRHSSVSVVEARPSTLQQSSQERRRPKSNATRMRRDLAAQQVGSMPQEEGVPAQEAPDVTLSQLPSSCPTHMMHRVQRPAELESDMKAAEELLKPVASPQRPLSERSIAAPPSPSEQMGQCMEEAPAVTLSQLPSSCPTHVMRRVHRPAALDSHESDLKAVYELPTPMASPQSPLSQMSTAPPSPSEPISECAEEEPCAELQVSDSGVIIAPPAYPRSSVRRAIAPSQKPRNPTSLGSAEVEAVMPHVSSDALETVHPGRGPASQVSNVFMLASATPTHVIRRPQAGQDVNAAVSCPVELTPTLPQSPPLRRPSCLKRPSCNPSNAMLRCPDLQPSGGNASPLMEATSVFELDKHGSPGSSENSKIAADDPFKVTWNEQQRTSGDQAASPERIDTHASTELEGLHVGLQPGGGRVAEDSAVKPLEDTGDGNCEEAESVSSTVDTVMESDSSSSTLETTQALLKQTPYLMPNIGADTRPAAMGNSVGCELLVPVYLKASLPLQALPPNMMVGVF